MPDNGTSVAARIAAAMKSAGLSRAELARRVGVSPAAASQWCLGTSTPTVDNLTKIAAALGVSLDELAGSLRSEGAGG